MNIGKTPETKKSEQSGKENEHEIVRIFVINGKILTKTKCLCISQTEVFFYNVSKWQECQKD